MDIRSWHEKQKFKRLRRIPSPNLNVKGIRHYLGDITIGEREWREKYGYANYRVNEHPPFMSGVPWNRESSSGNNLVQTDHGIQLIQPKEGGSVGAVLYSNFTIKYGTVQALIKFPDVENVLSAFWLYGENEMPEMDIVEHKGKNNEFSCTQHWGYNYHDKNKRSTLHNERRNKKLRLTERYYLYEVELTPYCTIYRINGITHRKVTKGVSSGNNHVILSIKNTEPDVALSKDAVMNVKWIDVFKIK
jgi:hypothetical protein